MHLSGSTLYNRNGVVKIDVSKIKINLSLSDSVVRQNGDMLTPVYNLSYKGKLAKMSSAGLGYWLSVRGGKYHADTLEEVKRLFVRFA